jgi:protein TonB
VNNKKAYQQFEESLFDGKNKDYGAYQLRKKQKNAQGLGIVVAVVIVSLGYLAPTIIDAVGSLFPEDEKLKVQQEIKVVNYSQLSAPPPIEMKNKPQPPVEVEKVISSKKFLKPVVKPDEEVPDDELIPTQEELQNVNAGTETVEGVDSVVYEGQMVIQEPEPEPEPAPEKVFQFVEQPPTFPGGEDALFKHIRKSLRYPTAAKDAGIEGTVIVRFVIASDGSITDISVIRGIGGGCDEASVDVIRSMPKWNPGKQNGRAVSVSYNLPLRFQIRAR